MTGIFIAAKISSLARVHVVYRMRMNTEECYLRLGAKRIRRNSITQNLYEKKLEYSLQYNALYNSERYEQNGNKVANLYTGFTILTAEWLLILPLSLAPQPSLGPDLLHKIRLNFLEDSQQFSFLEGRVVSPTPNPHSGGPGLCIYIPQRKGGYPF
jgi:hypothetical protein